MNDIDNQSMTKGWREKKPLRAKKIERTAEEWRKLIDEAKNKEMFWAKGIVHGSGDFVGTTGEEVEEE